MSSRTLRVAAVAVTSLLLVAGLVRAAGPDYQQREAAEFKAAMAKRKALGLDGDKAYEKLRKQYPTPEVKLTGAAESEGAAITTVCPGDTAKVFIGGDFQPGTSFVVENDHVKVLHEKLTPKKGWEASISVPKNFMPDDIYVQVAAPVSYTTVRVRAVAVFCKVHFKLKLDNGTALDVTLDPDKDSGKWKGTGTWKPGGPAPFTGSASGAVFNLSQVQSMEQAQAGMNKMQAAMASPQWKALDKRQEAAMAKLQACSTKPPAQMGKCMEGPSKQVDAIAAEREKLMNASSGASVGCHELGLEVHGTKVTGTATGCEEGSEHKVTGTFASP